MTTQTTSDDEHRLAQLGYKQELNRSWSGFSNFAISFSIISILAGCFTTFGQAWNNGGPVAISIGWPLIFAFILIIGFCMSELASAYTTSGGIYWWAAKLGGAKAGFYTGWLNLVGLLAVTASIGCGASFFLNALIGSYSGNYTISFQGGEYLRQRFFWFLVIEDVITIANIFSGHLLALLNNISVLWHVFGSAIGGYGGGSVIAILAIELSTSLVRVVMIISVVGQLFCATACLTSCWRMMFAFSRDGVVPGHKMLARVNKNRVPVNSVLRNRLGCGNRPLPRVKNG